ncbi:MAG: glycosyl hydrolase family 8 [Actinomycetota bacterium]
MRRRLQFRRRRLPYSSRIALVLIGLGSLAGIALTLALRTSEPGPKFIGAPASVTATERARVSADHFLDVYMDGDGRVERVDQGGDTVSEGQAYAMLLAAGIGDRARFDRAWSWTRENLQREDALLAWRWSEGAVQDSESATDADLDAARALLVAADRFDEREYLAEGLRIGDAILDHATVRVGDRLVLVAGPWARETAPYFINPSYFAPRTFALLERASGDERWGDLADSSRDIIRRFTERAALVPDWAVLTTSDEVYASPPPGEHDGEATYGFDAQRTYVRFAEDCEVAGRRLAASPWKLVAQERSHTIASAYSLQGKPLSEEEPASAVIGFAGVARGEGNTEAVNELLDRSQDVLRREPNYYGAAWVALGRMMLTTSLLGDCL